MFVYRIRHKPTGRFYKASTPRWTASTLAKFVEKAFTPSGQIYATKTRAKIAVGYLVSSDRGDRRIKRTDLEIVEFTLHETKVIEEE